MLQAAKERKVDLTEILVGILVDAVKRGDLPQPKTQRDRNQLEFI